MADLSDRKQQNQAFLQGLEKQRLNKDCLRIIDLRGRVPGECQAYQFGGRVHHLDDRAYLLVKQLMARFDGRYTVGVYEALFKALNQLQQATSVSPADNDSLIQTLKLDQPLSRAEARLVFSTPVQLRLDDVVYHGHTVDLAANAIRVTLKRTFSLHQDDTVSVSFIDFYQQTALACLQQIPYTLTKIEHDGNYTTVVLNRQAVADDAFGDWLQSWLERAVAQRPLDIDDELINLQAGFYQRLWLSKLSSPLLWLDSADAVQPLLLTHLMPTAHEQFNISIGPLSDWLTQLPLMQLAKARAAMLTAFNNEHSFSAALTQHKAVKQLINWHLCHPGSHLVLLRPQPIKVSEQALQQADKRLRAVDAGSADRLSQLCQRIQQCISLINLGPAFSQLQASNTVTAAHLNQLQTLKSVIDEEALAEPASLEPYIARGHERFHIHTPVTVHCAEQHWQVETLDASAEGLALKLPIDAPVSVNQRLEVDFDRWQTLTSKVDLSAIPYQIKNKLFWQGSVRLGLQRIKQNCPESLNQFFDWVISQNQEKLRRNQNDAVHSAEARLFSSLLLPGLGKIPLFLSLNDDAQRQIQFIGVTGGNQSHQNDGLWQAVQANMLRLNELLKLADSRAEDCLQTTLYACDNGHDHWTLAFEEDFRDARQKSLFLRRGLAADTLKVFHCSLSVLKGHESLKEADLNQGLQQWRQQRANRVRDIRQKLAQLLGMMELTDISDVFLAFYQA